MATANAGTTFGATVIPAAERPQEESLLRSTTLASPALTPTVSRDGIRQPHDALAINTDGNAAEKAISPFSCFYQHPPASFERVHSRAGSKSNLGFSEKDLESGAVTPVGGDDEHPHLHNNPFGASKASLDAQTLFSSSQQQQQQQQLGNQREDKMWPSRQTLLLARQEEKRKRRQRMTCAPVRERWSRLNKRQRLWVKVGVALLVVGAAVGVGVGISVAVHSGYYASKGNSNPIGHS